MQQQPTCWIVTHREWARFSAIPIWRIRLKSIASGGRDAYYTGDIAKSIVALSTRLGGTMTAEDLADYSSEWVEPISTTYHGWTVYEIPPNGQGIADAGNAEHHGKISARAFRP